MPWIVNVTRRTIRSIKSDGSYVGFDPRKKVFVAADQVSSDIAEYINNNKLRYAGGGSEMETPARTLVTPAPLRVEVLSEPVDIWVPASPSLVDEEGDMLANSDIEGQPETESTDGASGRTRRRRRKRH